MDWCDENGEDDVMAARSRHEEVFEAIDREVLAEFKELHERAPLYVYNDPSSHDVLAGARVTIDTLDGTYVAGAGKDRPLLRDGVRLSAEGFARAHYESRGWNTLELESSPFHALFGVLMWLWVQGFDSQAQMAMFGGREGIETDEHGLITTLLPRDFGFPGHALRRSSELEEHLEWISGKDLEVLFEYWVPDSRKLCAYLWAYTDDVLDRARVVLAVLPDETVVRILRFLAEHYWDRYLGWPDLLLWRGDEWMLVEVKSSKDRLSQDQKSWVLANARELQLPFRVAKIAKHSVVEPP